MLDKDRFQKEQAIRFCVLSGRLPFLEVNVENVKELRDTSTTITDIDVLGCIVDLSGKQRRVIFDCKTLGKTSPINRAMWASGLMAYTGCDEAFIILRKKASEAHRMSAKKLNVHLFDESQFKAYAESFSPSFSLDHSYQTNIDNWSRHAEIYKKGSEFEKFGNFLNNELPLEAEPPRGIKRLIAALGKGRGEFDPSKVAHQAVFCHALMMFSYMMAMAVHELVNIVDHDAKKDDFDRLIRYYIWGGRDTYARRQRMNDLFVMQGNGDNERLDLPEWEGFLELTRNMMDSPNDVIACCSPLRELSLKKITEPVAEKDEKLAQAVANSSRIRQFSIAQARYLIKATRLPTDFEEVLSQDFDELRTLVS